MTATLSAHWNGMLSALVLRHGVTADGAVLVRRVVLVAGTGELPVEIAEVRALTGALGNGVLGRLASAVSFFKVTANEALAEAGRTVPGTPMFGRKALLWLADGRPLGETVEILPRV